jgi:hypothetical protein
MSVVYDKPASFARTESYDVISTSAFWFQKSGPSRVSSSLASEEAVLLLVKAQVRRMK